MTLEELENTLIVIKYIYPIISAAFVVITSLLVYIWKTNTTRTDTILTQTNKTLSKITTLTAVHESEIENLKGAVFKKAS